MMSRKIRVVATDAFGGGDLSQLTKRETWALANKYTVNISESIAREMITKGLLREPGFEPVEIEVENGEGTVEDVPGEDTDGEVQPEPGASDSDEDWEDDPGDPVGSPGLG